MPKPTCCYVKSNDKPCGAKVSFKIVKDEDDNPIRKYSPFCPLHTAIVEKEKKEALSAEEQYYRFE